MKFVLYAKAQFSEQERALIEKYKVENYFIAEYVIDLNPAHVSLQGLVNGIQVETEADNFATLVVIEDKIKEGFRNLKTLLSAMAAYGGEETIEI